MRYPDHHTKLTITLLRCSCGYPRRGTVLFDASNNGCLILEFATVAESWTPLDARRSGGEDAGGRGGNGGARRGPDRVEDCLPLDRDGRGNHDAKRLAELFDAGPRALHAKRRVASIALADMDRVPIEPFASSSVLPHSSDGETERRTGDGG